MSSKIQNDKLIVSFQNGPSMNWNLPDKKDKETLRHIRKAAVKFVYDNMGTYGQVEAVKKTFTQAGYYLTR